MRKNYVAKLGALALALTLVTTGMMGSTLARYVSEVTGTATATVAGWSFKVNNNDSAFTAIDLGDTTNRTSYNATDIESGVIAPGTTGEFKIAMDGTGSGVGIDYIIKIAPATGTTLPTDLKFTVDGTEKTLTDMNTTGITGTIDQAADMKKDITVTWEWPFDDTDTADSNDNTFAGKTWTLDITATGKQVVPETTATP